nr:ATP synthase F0 subunit 8 [Haematopinus tuberculatus]
MPQMSPMWWMLLEIYFFANLMVCHSSFYWFFFAKSKITLKKKSFTNKNKLFLYDM